MKIILIILCFLFATEVSFSQSDFSMRNVVTGLDTPWEILWGPDNNIWVTERYGRISRVNPETGELNELIRLNDVFEDGERGLMGMVLHPDFEKEPYVYTVYNYRGNAGETWVRLIRLSYDGDKLHSPLIMLDSIMGAWNHDGSRLIIDEDLKLFMTTGDAAVSTSAQVLNGLNGKILRMNLDGTIPEDNPYGNSYVWSWGHRNPQGLVKANGIIYSSEHGPNTDDELNIIEVGRNYGWPQVNGFCDIPSEEQPCEDLNVLEPIAAWTPTLAVAGIDYYNHNLIPEWNNSILMVVLKSARLVQMKLSGDGKAITDENHFFTNEYGRLRDICISPDGRVFIATSNKDGRGNPKPEDDRIIEIKPNISGVEGLKKNDNPKVKITPNPFSDIVKICVDDNNISQIDFINSMGLIVNSLKGESQHYYWDGTDSYNNPLSNGIYFVRIKTIDEIITSTIVLSK